jgi:hypothetical protein
MVMDAPTKPAGPVFLFVSVINGLCAMPGDRPRYHDTLCPFLMDGILDLLYLRDILE